MKTAFTFTPGPWDVAFKPGERTAFIIGPGGDHVAFLFDRGILLSEVDKERANAVLIAAAPEMFALLKQISSYWEGACALEGQDTIFPENPRTFGEAAREIIARVETANLEPKKL